MHLIRQKVGKNYALLCNFILIYLCCDNGRTEYTHTAVSGYLQGWILHVQVRQYLAFSTSLPHHFLDCIFSMQFSSEFTFSSALLWPLEVLRWPLEVTEGQSWVISGDNPLTNLSDTFTRNLCTTLSVGQLWRKYCHSGPYLTCHVLQLIFNLVVNCNRDSRFLLHAIIFNVISHYPASHYKSALNKKCRIWQRTNEYL